jgi:hypothetical protein
MVLKYAENIMVKSYCYCVYVAVYLYLCWRYTVIRLVVCPAVRCVVVGAEVSWL